MICWAGQLNLQSLAQWSQLGWARSPPSPTQTCLGSSAPLFPAGCAAAAGAAAPAAGAAAGAAPVILHAQFSLRIRLEATLSAPLSATTQRSRRASGRVAGAGVVRGGCWVEGESTRCASSASQRKICSTTVSRPPSIGAPLDCGCSRGTPVRRSRPQS